MNKYMDFCMNCQQKQKTHQASEKIMKLTKMEKDLKFTNLQEIESYAAKTNRVLVVLDDYVLDATTFVNHHPGGSGLILNYRSKDITEQMKSHYPLSLVMANTMVVGSFKGEIERMMDPDQPLMRQIWAMDHQTYLKVIDSPHWLFVKSPRMFESNLFEMMSHNKWYSIFFIPLALLLTYLFKIDWTGCNPLALLPIAMAGFLAFTLVEYIIHRFIFHSEKYLFDNRVLRYLHYILHGIHHQLPVDPERITYPPALCFLTISFGYYTVYPFLHFQNPQSDCAFWVGFMLGYFAYDLTHYSLHHIDTSKHKGTYFHKLQRYHNQHHFGGEELGFGVSSKLWDVIFRTELPKKAMH